MTFKTKFVICIFICSLLFGFCTSINEANQRSPLVEIAKKTIYLHFYNSPKDLEDYASSLKNYPNYKKSAGVFVTLSSNGKTRACWGSVNPLAENVAKSTFYAALGALTKEYRYQPIKKSEITELKVQVTLIASVKPVKNISALNPLKDGLLVRAASRSGVILPGETVDAYYQLVQAKLKAGIHSGQPFQMYKLKADVYK